MNMFESQLLSLEACVSKTKKQREVRLAKKAKYRAAAKERAEHGNPNKIPNNEK